MPVTRNVAWDGRLESFKGRDTTQYVTTAAAIATTCALCRGPLRPDEPLSLSVDITESTTPDGTRLPAGHEPGYLTLNVGGETIYAERLDPDDPDDAEWARPAAAGRRETKRTNTLWQSAAPRKSESDRFGAASDELQPDHSPVRVCSFGHDLLQSRLGSFLATTE